MTEELSQAERTAMEAACRRADLQTRAVRHGWLAARDYYGEDSVDIAHAKQTELVEAEERERVLVEALEAVARNDKTVYEYSGSDALNRDGLPYPLPGARWITPREIARTTLGSGTESDHGPGEPSERCLAVKEHMLRCTREAGHAGQHVHWDREGSATWEQVSENNG